MRRRLRTAAMAAAGAAALALALPGAAGAGGFATVGLSSLPDGTAPGKAWHVTLTILQHGITPLDGIKPTISIRSADGETTRTYAARPAGKPGLYTADVVFPTAGRWRYTINDGFSQTHTFAPVAIGASKAVPVPGSKSSAEATSASGPIDRDGGDGGANVAAALGAAVAAGLLAALAAVLVLRRRPPGEAAA